MRIIGLLILIFSKWIWALPAHNQLIQKVEHIQNISADFQQVVFINGRRSASSHGHFVLSRPGQMRWITEKPSRQILVADGQYIWVYEPALQQATKRLQKHGIAGTAGLFLSAKPNLWVQAYQVRNIQAPSGEQAFQLNAKNPKRSIAKLILRFKHDVLQQIEFWDQLGQYSQITLQHSKVNQKLAASVFRMTLPKQVDVIDLG
jgi:outer membrane lipoprotein carrier protein